MKKILLGSIVLCLFAVSIVLVEVSCSKSKATPLENSQINRIVYLKMPNSGNKEIWTANYDGSNAVQVPIALPPDVNISGELGTTQVRLSPDGQTVFFTGELRNSSLEFYDQIYACDINGSNLRVAVSNPNNSGHIKLGGAY